MALDFGLNLRVRAVRISVMCLAVFSVVVAADGAHRGRLFGPLRGDSDDDEPKQTYYQPRELQRVHPTLNALPAADPKSMPTEGNRNTPSVGQGEPSAAAPRHRRPAGGR